MNTRLRQVTPRRADKNNRAPRPIPLPRWAGRGCRAAAGLRRTEAAPSTQAGEGESFLFICVLTVFNQCQLNL
jgi:hypothetical protein